MQYVKGSVWIAEGFFTESEVDEIYAAANKQNWQTGAVGNGAANFHDPDAEDLEHGAVVNEIRQSQVKWLEHQHLSQNFHEKLAAAIKYASGDKDWKWDGLLNKLTNVPLFFLNIFSKTWEIKPLIYFNIVYLLSGIIAVTIHPFWNSAN